MYLFLLALFGPNNMWLVTASEELPAMFTSRHTVSCVVTLTETTVQDQRLLNENLKCLMFLMNLYLKATINLYYRTMSLGEIRLSVMLAYTLDDGCIRDYVIH